MGGGVGKWEIAQNNLESAYNNPLKSYFPVLKFIYTTVDQTNFGNRESIFDFSYGK